MEEQNYGITLVCFNCGKKVEGVINQSIQFAFELADIANKAGMLGIFDMYHARTLVFCNQECADNQKTKSGQYRVRAKKLV